jgi:hypothetical protein
MRRQETSRDGGFLGIVNIYYEATERCGTLFHYLRKNVSRNGRPWIGAWPKFIIRSTHMNQAWMQILRDTCQCCFIRFLSGVDQ